MNINQQRAEFEALEKTRFGYGKDTLVRYPTDEDEYYMPLTQARWEGYQSALASPEVQKWKKDAERLDFMISEECQIQSLITPNEVRHRLGWPEYGEAQSEWFTNPRAALDAAMEKHE